MHFQLQHYDRVKSTLQNNRQLGMALLEGYDQIPQPTLDVYRYAARRARPCPAQGRQVANLLWRLLPCSRVVCLWMWLAR